MLMMKWCKLIYPYINHYEIIILKYFQFRCGHRAAPGSPGTGGLLRVWPGLTNQPAGQERIFSIQVNQAAPSILIYSIWRVRHSRGQFWIENRKTDQNCIWLRQFLASYLLSPWMKLIVRNETERDEVQSTPCPSFLFIFLISQPLLLRFNFVC